LGAPAWPQAGGAEGNLAGVRPAILAAQPYVRLELGGTSFHPGDETWLPPGPSDPRVYFDLDDDNAGFGYLGAGVDWKNGFRADVGLAAFGKSALSSLPGTTIPADNVLHAAITGGTVKSHAVMATLSYSPLEQGGNAARFQPFVSLGIGPARNSVSDWTRTNLSGVRDDRTFEGDTTTELAWSAGIGFAYRMAGPAANPVTLEVAYRYFDLGHAQGGTAPLPGNGSSSPQEPLNFDIGHSVFTIGLRVPLVRH
jgi:opacity protein-like surface antigen